MSTATQPGFGRYTIPAPEPQDIRTFVHSIGRKVETCKKYKEEYRAWVPDTWCLVDGKRVDDYGVGRTVQEAVTDLAAVLSEQVICLDLPTGTAYHKAPELYAARMCPVTVADQYKGVFKVPWNPKTKAVCARASRQMRRQLECR